MNVQTILVLLLFAAALIYVGRVIYRTVTPKNGCGSNCKCGVDFSDVKIPEEKS